MSRIPYNDEPWPLYPWRERLGWLVAWVLVLGIFLFGPWIFYMLGLSV